MFRNMSELVKQAESGGQPISAVMIAQEAEQTGKSEPEILDAMRRRIAVMRHAVEQGQLGVQSHSGLTGGDAARLRTYLDRGSFLTDRTFVSALCYAIATNEVNASMGLICATPTAGSSGVLPGVLLAAQEKLGTSDEALLQAFFTAGAIGYVIANNAFVSGAAGGCQAEVGSASAMAAAAVTEMAGGSPSQAAHAMAMALKNMLGLVCDPVAGLVEVPCIKRNAGGAAIALSAAEMALAGVESRIPWDEVIAAMYQVGLAIPVTLRETAMGGLAATETGRRWKRKLRTTGGSTAGRA